MGRYQVLRRVRQVIRDFDALDPRQELDSRKPDPGGREQLGEHVWMPRYSGRKSHQAIHGSGAGTRALHSQLPESCVRYHALLSRVERIAQRALRIDFRHTVRVRVLRILRCQRQGGAQQAAGDVNDPLIDDLGTAAAS